MTEQPILFVINSLAGGGAERIFTQVVAGLQDRFPIEVVLLDREEAKYDLHGVSIATLDARGSMARSAAALATHARARRPALIVSFLARANCAAVVAASAIGAKAVISERVHASSHFAASGRSALAGAALRALYPRAARVIAVSDGVAEDLARNFGVQRSRITTIYNPVDVERIRANACAAVACALPERFIVAAGRLTKAKNFAMLIEAFAMSGMQDHLVILGEGPERNALRECAAAFDVGDRVHLPGYAANPHAIMARAEAFVSSSNAEGFPNALVEAMALGLPVIATDCPSGPAEILGDEWGVLVRMNDAREMAFALHAMDSAHRAHYALRSAERVRAFAPEIALERYAAVIEDALQHKAVTR
jgi:N-acetylgalactosamine-N,N'-diacetylbacillosaminyl-diphospho-undecaprenol 4-alpha-N-acetylgalactosaminyltransferase